MSEATKPFAEWLGRQTRSDDVVTDRLVDSFRAIFAPHLAELPGAAVPLGLHWCLSPVIAGMADLGPDGHPAKNRNMPPIPQPRRMWAGGWVETTDMLRIGDRVTRISTIADITTKKGRSGELWFVSMDHDYITPRGLAIRERHDIVYRAAASSGGATAVPPEPPRATQRTWRVETPPTLLFRFSAITFNGHRIHYDLPYATGVEGYGGLVVHGPIQAALLFNLAAEIGGQVPRRFAYRGVTPALSGSVLLVAAGEAEGRFWTQGSDGTIHMEAQATR